MDYLADMGIIHCAECGRLFRPHHHELLCSGCRENAEEPAIEDYTDLPHERVAAFLRFFDALSQAEEQQGRDASAIPGVPCRHCLKAPAGKDSPFCDQCRIAMEYSFKQAASDIFGRIRDVHAKHTKAFHVMDAINDKRHTAGGPGSNYSGAQRLKY